MNLKCAVSFFLVAFFAAVASARNATVFLTPESPRFSSVWTRTEPKSDFVEILVVVEKEHAPKYVLAKLVKEGVLHFQAEITLTRFDRAWFAGFKRAGDGAIFGGGIQGENFEIYYLSLASSQVKHCTVRFQDVRPPKRDGVLFDLRMRDFVK